MVDPELRLPADAALLKSLDQAPLTIACRDDAADDSARAAALREAGVDVLGLPAVDGRLQLIDLMVHLSGVHNCSTVLVEAGPGLLSALLQEQLINDAMVFVAPMLLGDADGLPALKGFAPETVQDARVG